MSTTHVSAVPRPVSHPGIRRHAIALASRLKDSVRTAYFALRAVVVIAANWPARPHGI